MGSSQTQKRRVTHLPIRVVMPYNEIENICFTSFNLRIALQFLKGVETFDSSLRVKTIIIATESDKRERGELESDAVPQGDNGSRIGQPRLEEARQMEKNKNFVLLLFQNS
jgi:hypothetical protein